jgi:hypothetical protein
MIIKLKNGLVWVTVAACGMVFTVYAIIRIGSDGPSALKLHSPPQLPSITVQDFTSDTMILPALSQEALRMIIAAGHCAGVVEVLSPTLRHIYTIRAYETAISNGNSLSDVARMSTGPTPMLPPVEVLIEAYKALNEDTLTQFAIDFAAAMRAQAIADRSAALIKRFREGFHRPGLIKQRIAYVRAHREEILPESKS